MIIGFKDKETERIFYRGYSRMFLHRWRF